MECLGNTKVIYIINFIHFTKGTVKVYIPLLYILVCDKDLCFEDAAKR